MTKFTTNKKKEREKEREKIAKKKIKIKIVSMFCNFTEICTKPPLFPLIIVPSFSK